MQDRTIRLVAAALIGCGAFASGAASGEATLVRDGQARVTIYAPPGLMAPQKPAQEAPGRARLRQSVEDLALTLGRMSGATIGVVAGAPPAGARTTPLLIGELGAKRFGPPAAASPFQQAFRVVVSPEAIACIGQSDEATSYAIYEILDRLGCRWYLPSDLGEVIPHRETLRLPEMDFSHVPATVCRNIWYADAAYRRRNRLGGITYHAGHALEGYITDDQRRAHPEWNAEIRGRRDFARGGRICWGNPDVARAVAQNIIQRLDAKYVPCVSISPGDGMTFCQCAKCKALDAGDRDPAMACISLTDRYIHFCNQIAEQVTQKHPDVILGMLAYAQYTRPPVREKPHPSIVPQLAPITYCRAHSMADPHCPSAQSLRPIVEGWGKAVRLLAIYQYAYNLAEVSCPFPMITKWSRDLPILYQSGVKLWTPETMANFESTLPGLYLGVRMSWYPQAKPEAILEELFTRFYGAAAEPMRRYWTLLDDAWARVPEHAGCRFGHPVRFTPEVMRAARAAIDQALAACRTAMEYRRVKLADDSLRGFELYMKMLRDFADGRWTRLEADGDRWMGRWDSLHLEYREQSAFPRFASIYYRAFCRDLYRDATRVARDTKRLTRPLRRWRYRADRDRQGVALGWSRPELDDKDWKTTDPRVESWASLGLFDYFGTVWYRAKARAPAVDPGKRVFLWLGGTDGSARLFVNGRHVPFVNAKGEAVEEFSGYCAPASFDITAVVKPDADNHLAIAATRSADFINELGTGGLTGPVVLYQEK